MRDDNGDRIGCFQENAAKPVWSGPAQCRRDLDGDRCQLHGGKWGYSRCVTVEVLAEVMDERARQFARYGTNDGLQDGTGPSSAWLSPIATSPATMVEMLLRGDYERFEARTGNPTWMHMVREEIAEAFQEKDPLRLEEELLQVAALCVSWVETLRGRR